MAEEGNKPSSSSSSETSYSSVIEAKSNTNGHQEKEQPANDNNNSTYEPSRQVGIRLENTLTQLTDKVNEMNSTFQKQFNDMSKQMDRLEKSLIELSE